MKISLSLHSSYPGRHAGRLRPGLARQPQKPVDDPRERLMFLDREGLPRVEGQGRRGVGVVKAGGRRRSC